MGATKTRAAHGRRSTLAFDNSDRRTHRVRQRSGRCRGLRISDLIDEVIETSWRVGVIVGDQNDVLQVVEA
jgi:hypothetical protein